MIRTGFRAFVVAASIFGFLIEAALRESKMSVMRWNENRRRHARIRAIGDWSRFLLRRMGFSVQFEESSMPLPKSSAALFVCNHLSFWDVVALASKTPAVFVTSVEVRDTPVLGWICRAAGCVFVERRSRDRKGAERAEVAQILSEGFSVILFPEATSTNGSAVLPFKRSFFTPAIETETPVVPLCIQYREIDGEPVTFRNRDEVFYYGDLQFHTTLAHAFRLHSVTIEISAGAPIVTSRDSTNREQLVSEAYQFVANRFEPIITPTLLPPF